MEGNGNIEYSSKLRFEVENGDGDDVKCVNKYSAILVATIQEAKDRISQIEYIFCKQLYSHFQFQSQSFKESQDSWKQKEKDFVFQIEKLRLQNQQLLEETRRLRVEKESMLSFKESNMQTRIDELEEEVRKKSKEIDEGLEMQNRLLQLFQAKSSMVLEKGKLLKEREGKVSELLDKVSSLEKEVEVLKGEVREKTDKVIEKEVSGQELVKSAESLMLELRKRDEAQSAVEKEKEKCEWKLECLEGNVNELEKKLVKMGEEVEAGRVTQMKLLQQIDMNNMEILKQKQKLDDCESERKLFMEKVNGLEKENNELKENISRSTNLADGKDLREKLLQEIEVKDSQILTMKKSCKDLSDKYKSLKSQYNYLCAKSGLTEDNMLPSIKLEYESGPELHQQKLHASPDLESKDKDTAAGGKIEMRKVKIENEAIDGLEDDKKLKLVSMSSFHSPKSSYIAPKCPSTSKSAPLAGTKRPASRWIETRSHQRREGFDPHDDFLDTPLENLRGALDKATKDKVHDIQIPVQKDLQPDSSDDETQDMNNDPGPEKQQVPLQMAGKKTIKYVEPVRKKAERENLQGVECKQCKKFYDAVLPDGGKDVDGKNQNIRCEHHDGVSRHRYKYMPPMTPEGFWNIGFESEM